jgi:hypothetical protein
MKTNLLPSTRQISTPVSDVCHRVINFAWNVVSKQHLTTKNRHKTKLHFVSLVLLLLLIQGVASGQTSTLYLQSTQTQSSTGTSVRDLATAIGSSGTVTSTATSSTTFAEMLAFTIDINNLSVPIDGNSFPVSVNVSARSSSALQAQFRLQRVNSSGTVLASTGYSSTFNSTGIQTATLSFTPAQTWASGDRLRLSIEVMATSGNNRTITVSTGNASSFVKYGPTITTSTISGSPFCSSASGGSSVSVSFTSLGTFSGNTYTAQ